MRFVRGGFPICAPVSRRRPYLLLGREDDGQVASFALAVGLALRPVPGGPRDEVAAVAEEVPVVRADDGRRRGLRRPSDDTRG